MVDWTFFQWALSLSGMACGISWIMVVILLSDLSPWYAIASGFLSAAGSWFACEGHRVTNPWASIGYAGICLMAAILGIVFMVRRPDKF